MINKLCSYAVILNFQKSKVSKSPDFFIRFIILYAITFEILCNLSESRETY